MKFLKLFLLSIFVTFVGMFAALYVTVCPAWNPDLVRAMLFHPTPGVMEPNPLLCLDGIRGVEKTIPCHGDKMDAWFYKVPHASKVILFTHGVGGNVAQRYEKISVMLKAGQSIFAYDFRGYGRSTGVPSVPSVVEDAYVAYDFLVKQLHYRPDQIIAYGESLGSGVSSELTRHRVVSAVIVESGFTSLEAICKERIPALNIFPSPLFMKPELNTASIMERQHPPLLVIHGADDDQIPKHHAYEIAARACEPKKLVILAKCGHALFDADAAKFSGALKAFIDETSQSTLAVSAR